MFKNNLPRRVLVFSANQDDETIGCGGFLHRLSISGSICKIVFMTDGSTGISQDLEYQNIIREQRKNEAEAAAQILGVAFTEYLDYSCQNLCNDQEIFHRTINIIRDFKPNLVITHSDKDKHRDHRMTCDIVKESCWKASENIHNELGLPHRVDDVWSMEITDLISPDFVVDISESFLYKDQAMKEYVSQSNVIPAVYEQIDFLSSLRGKQVGVLRGEGFSRISMEAVLI